MKCGRCNVHEATDGKRSCDSCRESYRRYRRANRKRRQEQSRKYYAANKTWFAKYREDNGEKYADWRRQNRDRIRDTQLWTKFRIRLTDYNRMLEEQGGVCAACGRGPGKRQLAVDHDHATGAVRGLLCMHCNMTLGRYRDSPTDLLNLAKYIEKNAVKPRLVAAQGEGVR